MLERLVDRAVVLGEDHRPAADGPLAGVLADRDLLLAVNLIHEHAHHHGALLHSHPHAHPPGREHHDQAAPEHYHEHGPSTDRSTSPHTHAITHTSTTAR